MEFFEVLYKRKSIRSYKKDPVSEEKLKKVLDAARVAPSACNKQPWHFIVIREEKIRKELQEAYSKEWFYSAPVIVCACGEVSKNWVRKYDNKNYNDVDVTIAMDHLILAATAEGLGTCWIAAFNPEVVRKVLNLPQGIEPVALTPLGYPEETFGGKTDRKTLSDIIHWEKW